MLPIYDEIFIGHTHIVIEIESPINFVPPPIKHYVTVCWTTEDNIRKVYSQYNELINVSIFVFILGSS